MKPYYLLIRLTATLLLFGMLSTAIFCFATPPARQFYQLIIYHMKDNSQEQRMDAFLARTYLPTLHNSGIKNIGVFKTAGIDTAKDKKIMLFITYTSLAQFHQVTQRLNTDKEVSAKGADYFKAAFDHPAFSRKESILMESFTGMPQPRMPVFKNAKKERIYELRSYESATDQLYQRKVDMFNKEELEIFDRIKSQAVFYGEVISGSHMPNLMYMTTYANLQERDAHWKTFNADPKWKKISALPEYQHVVSNATIDLLTPADYSDF